MSQYSILNMRGRFHSIQPKCGNILIFLSILATAMRAAVVSSTRPLSSTSPSPSTLTSSHNSILTSSHLPVSVSCIASSSPLPLSSTSASPITSVVERKVTNNSESGNDLSSLSRTLSGRSEVGVHDSLQLLRKVLLDDYTQWHKRSRRSRDVQRLVYQQKGAQPGLGDRFTALLAGYIHAVASQRLFLVDWTEPFALRDALAPRYVNVFWDERDENCTGKPSVSSCDGGYCTRDAMNSKAHTLYYAVAHPYHVVDVLNVLRIFGGKNTKRELLKVKEEELMGDSTLFGAIFNKLFVPSKTLSKIMEERAGPMLRGGYVSIHARLGSGVSEQGPRFSKINHDCVAHLLLRAVRKWQSRTKAKGVFLATDTPSFRDLFKNRANRENVGRVMSGGWATKHVARMKVDDKNDREIFFLSMMELVLIGRGRAIIGMGSRFADVGGFFSGKDANIEVGLNGECNTWILSVHQHIWQTRRDKLSNITRTAKPSKAGYS